MNPQERVDPKAQTRALLLLSEIQPLMASATAPELTPRGAYFTAFDAASQPVRVGFGAFSDSREVLFVGDQRFEAPTVEQAIEAARKSPADKKIDREIEQAYYKAADGRQIDIMQIGPLWDEALELMKGGKTAEEIMPGLVEKYCAPASVKASGGWEKTIKKMKKAGKVDNPWALANWMKKEGYTPGGKKTEASKVKADVGWRGAEAGDGKAWKVVAEEPVCTECMFNYVEARGEDPRIDEDIEAVDAAGRPCTDCGKSFGAPLEAKKDPQALIEAAGEKEAQELDAYAKANKGDRIGWLSQHLGLDMDAPESYDLVTALKEKLEGLLGHEAGKGVQAAKVKADFKSDVSKELQGMAELGHASAKVALQKLQGGDYDQDIAEAEKTAISVAEAADMLCDIAILGAKTEAKEDSNVRRSNVRGASSKRVVKSGDVEEKASATPAGDLAAVKAGKGPEIPVKADEVLPKAAVGARPGLSEEETCEVCEGKGRLEEGAPACYKCGGTGVLQASKIKAGDKTALVTKIKETIKVVTDETFPELSGNEEPDLVKAKADLVSSVARYAQAVEKISVTPASTAPALGAALKVKAFWVNRVQENWKTLSELEGASRNYSVAERLGFDDPEDLWEANPYVLGGTNPVDLQIIEDEVVAQQMREVLESGISDKEFRKLFLTAANLKASELPESAVDAYLVTALWSSTDQSDEAGGDPMDRNYGVEDIAPETLAEAEKDVADFMEKASEFLAKSEADQGQIGHDLWLTRNHHGAGFWDGPEMYGGEENAKALTDLAHAMGEVDLYIGDDGKIYANLKNPGKGFRVAAKRKNIDFTAAPPKFPGKITQEEALRKAGEKEPTEEETAKEVERHSWSKRNKEEQKAKKGGKPEFPGKITQEEATKKAAATKADTAYERAVKLSKEVAASSKYLSLSEPGVDLDLKDFKEAREQMRGVLEDWADAYVNNGWNEDSEDRAFEKKFGVAFDSLKKGRGDNTYNQSYLGPDVNTVLYTDPASDKVWLEARLHEGGDVRGNYTGGYYKEYESQDEAVEDFYGLINGSPSVNLTFEDGSTLHIYGQQDSDMPHYQVSDATAKGAMAEEFLDAIKDWDQWDLDNFIDETVDAAKLSA